MKEKIENAKRLLAGIYCPDVERAIKLYRKLLKAQTPIVPNLGDAKEVRSISLLKSKGLTTIEPFAAIKND